MMVRWVRDHSGERSQSAFGPFVDTYSTAKDLPILRRSSSLPDGNGMFGAAPSEASLPGKDRAVRWVSSVNLCPVNDGRVCRRSLPGKRGSRAAVPDAGSLPGKDRAARLSLRTDLYPVKMELPDRGAGESLSVWMGALIAVGVRGDCASTASCRSIVIP